MATDFTLDVADSQGLTDGTTSLGHAADVSEVAGSTDVVTLGITLGVDATDAIGLVDTIALSADRVVTQSDTVGLTDAVSFAIEMVKGDTIGLTDTATAGNDAVITVTDAVGLTDSPAADLGVGTPTPVDSIGLTDGAVAVGHDGVMADMVGLTDSVSLTIAVDTTVNLLIQDEIGLTEDGVTHFDWLEEFLEDTGQVDSLLPVPVSFVDLPTTDTLSVTDEVIVVLSLGVGSDLTLTVIDGTGATDTALSSLFAGSTPLLRLVGLDLMDDHPRPQDWFWRRVRPPVTPVALLLYRDGRVIRVTTLSPDQVVSADYIAGGGYDTLLEPDSWQVQVLTAAGYTLEPAI